MVLTESWGKRRNSKHSRKEKAENRQWREKRKSDFISKKKKREGTGKGYFSLEMGGKEKKKDEIVPLRKKGVARRELTIGKKKRSRHAESGRGVFLNKLWLKRKRGYLDAKWS